MKKQKPNALLMLAEFFIDAYKAAVAKFGHVAALLDRGVQDMRRLYIAARARAEAARAAECS